MRILNSEEWQQAWRAAVARPGLSAPVLMHRAGNAVVQFCTSHFTFRSVCVLCGRDRGEAIAASAVFAGMDLDVSTIVLAHRPGELPEDVALLCSRLQDEPIWIANESAFESDSVRQALAADLIVDAVSASGLSASASSPGTQAVAAISAINDALGTVVSVGLPSGADPDSKTSIREGSSDVVFAQGVISFIAPNPAHVFGELTLGPIAVNELGVQPVLTGNHSGLQVTSGQEVGIAFPPRPPDAHKGHFGHVLVIAGSRGKAGAAGLAGIAALRAGAGLVTVACPSSVQAAVAGFAAELMTEGLPETSDGTIALEAVEIADKLLAGKNALVIGPGLSTDEQTVACVRQLVARCALPTVIDADALNAFAGRAGELKQSRSPFRVLTPHPGEAARLLGISTAEVQADRLAVARRISSETGCCVALKGWRTVVAGLSGETWINMSGNVALAKGGSGDVLAGIIGASLARNQQAEDSGRIRAFFEDVRVSAAVHLHGLAGDIAREQLDENTVLAGDVIGRLFLAFRFCEQQRKSGQFYLQK